MNNEKQQVDNLVDIIQSFSFDKDTILTGNNGSGKSMIRKQIQLKLHKLDINCKALSMELRTTNNPDLGAFSDAGLDNHDISTSQNTLRLLDGLFKDINEDTKYVILDEFEIGCSEETIYSFCIYIKEQVNLLREKGYDFNLLVITHSKIVVDILMEELCTEFINLEGIKRPEDWIKRLVYPYDLNILRDNKLFKEISNRLR